MVVGITYTDENMTTSAGVCHDSMRANGFDKAMIKTWADLSTEFRWFNKDILPHKRGAGYWAWKAYLIYTWLLELNEGDILIYSDAGCEWIDNPKHIIDVMDQDLFLFTSGHLHREWCKGDVLAITDKPDALQVQASVIFIRVSDYSRRFIKEWLLWCQMPGLITDEPSIKPNHPDFREHRHDQAILTALAIREGIKLHWWPDAIWFQNQRHRWPDDKYPPMVRHHRKRNHEWA